MAAGAAFDSTKSINGIMDDDDGRTRNAKAQRRHREKRKAHLKTLEETVSLLTNQLEDSRRQLSSAAYSNRMGVGSNGAPLSPGSKDFAALQQENAYLREENAELRRQLYNYSVGRHYQPPAGDTKPEGYAGYEGGAQAGNGNGQAQGALASPREGSSGGREGQPTGNTADGFTPRGTRSRVMSLSSAPTASPYPPPTSTFPTDPRAHALNQSQPGADRYPIRYEPHLYAGSSANHSPTTANAPAPHNLPRSGLGYDHIGDMYSGREGDASWGPDAGPPPFQGSVYPVPYGDGPQDEWRQGQEH